MASSVININSGGINVGTIKSFAGAEIPSKWKLCNGDIVSRNIYSELFSVIGTTYGGGDGTTTFGIPDLTGRTPIGKSSTHLLGELGGEEEHTLTSSEMPGHAHSMNIRNAYSGTLSGAMHIVAGHWDWTKNWNEGGHTPSMNLNTDKTGGSSSHSVMQPYSSVNYIIFTGVA